MVFMQGSVLIDQSIDAVFGYIADCENWPEHLDHVTAIENLVRDGQRESFTMSIRELSDGHIYSVDSRRIVNRESRTVDFTQPRPPKGFATHQGGWRFVGRGPGRTELVSFHRFSLEGAKGLAEACALIRKHIKAALGTWAEIGNH